MSGYSIGRPSGYQVTYSTLAALAAAADGFYAGPWGPDADDCGDGLSPAERREWFVLTGDELPGWDDDDPSDEVVDAMHTARALREAGS